MSEPEIPSFDERAWIVEAIHAARNEAALYVRALAGISLRPARFAEAWARGARTMNPAGFVATSATVIAVSGHLVQSLAGETADSSGLATELLHALFPYTYLAALGALTHLALRVVGSRRRLAGSVALALFAGAGPGSVTNLSLIAIKALLVATSGFHERAFVQNVPRAFRLPLFAVVLLMGVWPYISLGRALTVFHRARWQRTTICLTAATFVLAFAFGALHHLAHVKDLGWLHLVLWLNGPDLWF